LELRPNSLYLFFLFIFFDFMPIYSSGALIANRYEVVQGPREKPSLSGGMGLVYPTGVAFV